MKTSRLFAFWLALASVTLAAAQDNLMRPAATPTAAPNRFVKVDALDFKSLVPPPPAAGSIAAQGELETILQVQSWRTADQIEWAKRVARDDVFNHAGIIGPWFTAERLPLTANLFKEIGDDLRAIDALAKKPFQRPRPSAIDPRVQPCVDIPANASYPSSSAMQALVWAELLGEALPAKRDDLIARAHRAAWGRVIGGVHFPSDLVAGQRLARVYVTECRKSAKFREAFTACRQELAAASVAP